MQIMTELKMRESSRWNALELCTYAISNESEVDPGDLLNYRVLITQATVKAVSDMTKVVVEFYKRVSHVFNNFRYV